MQWIYINKHWNRGKPQKQRRFIYKLKFIAEKEDVSLRNKNNAEETLHVLYFASENPLKSMFNSMMLLSYKLSNILTQKMFHCSV